MPMLYKPAHHPELLTGVMLWAALALIYSLYLNAHPGMSLFDDSQNLSGLTQISDIPSLLAFITGGGAGPGGRPVALATFTLNAPSWPDSSWDFVHVGLCIHLLNTCLIILVMLHLSRLLGYPSSSRLAVFIGTLWASQPLLASSNLLIVQRMTTVSATFVLLGLLTYISARQRMQNSSIVAGGWHDGFKVGACLLLSAYAKESGILLAFFLLAIEILLPKTSRPQNFWLRPLSMIGITLPLFIIVFYLFMQWPSVLQGYSSRAFTIDERLLTETRILWRYLMLVAMPRSSAFSPFNEDYEISLNLWTPWTTAVAALGWVTILGSSIILRNRNRLLAFAVFWWLGGHFLEGSFVPLELYFEHRNYMPTTGIFLALYIFLISAKINQRTLEYTSIITFSIALLGLNTFVLSEITTIWSQPRVAARLWHQWHPGSARAAQFLAQTLASDGDAVGARAAIVETATRVPTDATLALQTVQLGCFTPLSMSEFNTDVESALQRISSTPVMSLGVIDTIGKMVNTLWTKECPALTPATLHRIIDTLLSNPTFHDNHFVAAALYFQQGRIFDFQGKINEVIGAIRTAVNLHAESGSVLALAGFVASTGDYTQALKILDDGISLAPDNRFIRARWTAEFHALRAALTTSKMTTEINPAP